MVLLMMGYLFLIMYRPAEVWPVLGTLRIELLYMMPVGAVWLASPDKRLSFNGLVFGVVGMVAAVVICAIASPWADKCLDIVDPWIKLQVFFFMLITSVNDEKSMKRLLATWLVVVGLYMLHSFYEFGCGRHVSRMGINRMVGVDSTNGDPNAFATTLLLSLVLVPAFWRTSEPGMTRWLLAGYLGLAMLCISFTGSRTGFVALAIFFMASAWNSPWRSKAIIALIVFAPIGFLALPAELQNRFETIVNPDVGPKNAQMSAHGRWEGFEAGMKLWSDNLAMGVGPGAWLAATGRKLQAHNLYGQMAGEMGIVGITAFFFLLLAYAASYLRIRRAYREHPEWGKDFSYHVANSCAMGILLLLFTGLSGHNLFRPQWLLYAAFLIIVQNLIAERIKNPSPAWESSAEAEEWAEEQRWVPAME
jgi:O-antigen ligase